MIERPTLRLRVVPPGRDPFAYFSDRDTFVAGRSPRADLSIRDPALSREHARFTTDGRSWSVEDMASRNGTLVNGTRITSATALRPGDLMEIGMSRVEVVPLCGAEEEETGDLLSFHHEGAIVLEPASEFPGPEGQIPSPEAPGFGAEHRRALERLLVLQEVHKALGGVLEGEESPELILDRVFTHLEPEQAALFLREPAGTYRRVAVRGGGPAFEGPALSRSLVREVGDRGNAVLALDVRENGRFSASESLSIAGVRSLMAAPLKDTAGVVGIIVLVSRAFIRRYSEEDLQLLVILASAAALRIRNLRLTEEALERERLEREILLARNVQLALLPDSLPEVPGYELYAENLPARIVSGDFYDVSVRRGGEEVLLFMADVSGKGIAASFLTASLDALCAAPLEDGLPPEEVLGKVSRLLFQRTTPEKYATAFLAALDPATGTVRYSNAGHNPGLVLKSAGNALWLGSTGLPLGIMPEGEFRGTEFRLEPGDTLLLYTDGITEAADAGGNEYCRERMFQACHRHRNRSLEAMAEGLRRDLESFVGGEPFLDDRTLLVVRRAAK